MPYMNIQDKEDDRLVIGALCDLFTKLRDENERMRRDVVSHDAEISKNVNDMERINRMLTRWQSPNAAPEQCDFGFDPAFFARCGQSACRRCHSIVIAMMRKP